MALIVTAQILNKKGVGNKWFFCVERSHVYLDFEKIKDAEKPTSEEKAQIEELRTLLGGVKVKLGGRTPRMLITRNQTGKEAKPLGYPQQTSSHP